jgi:hypothetical protein
MERTREWSVGIYSGKTPFELQPAEGVENPVLAAKDVTDRKADFVADPFLAFEGGTWYLFVEVLNSANEQGDIGLATSRDGRRFHYEQIVLDEPFHLSYPYVFKWDGEYYMIPESYEGKATRLYHADQFPKKWSRAADLIHDDITDPSILRYADRWWLFACAHPHANDKLVLYSADQLTGPWVVHPKSPLTIGDGHNSRPGGRVIEVDGRLYRMAQDDDPAYGLNVNVFEIMELTPTSYAEKAYPKNPVLRGSGSGWNQVGMHQLDAHQSSGGWIAAVDGHRFVTAFGWKY